jgi:hypothetical protein
MPDRSSLHKLIDTLPEDALAVVAQVLQRYETWPPSMPPEHAYLKKMLDRAKELIPQPTEGCYGGISAGANGSSSHDCMAHASTFRNGTLLNVELRQFRGRELQLQRRLGISEDQRKLFHSLTIRGPDGKEAHWEIEFNCSDAV